MEYAEEVEEEDDDSKSTMRKSLFPNVPPYIRFLPPEEEYSQPLCSSQLLVWKAPSGVDQVVGDCVHHAGFKVIEGQHCGADIPLTASVWEKVGDMEKEIDEIDFAGLNEEVKINQFPGMYAIGRKDWLGKSYQKMVEMFGQENFDFHPNTFLLPDDYEKLVKFMEINAKPMIIKPPNWFNGMGIKLINKIDDIPLKQGRAVVQDYVDNPFLINGLKFDIRLYILITSIDPIKMYIYEDGIVNFATAQYTNDPQQLSNKFIHLTNYSINKTNPNFKTNCSPGDYSGHKWNLSTLWRYLSEELCIDWRPVWEQTKEICVKTVLCGHQHIKREVASQIKSEYNCYKLLGFDVLYDANLKPWLLEVNNNPSLLQSTIDSLVNRPMLPEMFNIVGFHIPNKRSLSQNLQGLENIKKHHDNRIYSSLRTKEEDVKIEKIMNNFVEKECNLDNIIDQLLPSEVRIILRFEDELSQTKSWTRIFPASNTQHLLQFISSPSYSDLILAAWEERFGTGWKKREQGQEFMKNLCQEMYHLKVPEIILDMSRFPLRLSLFPNVPPYIRFLLPGQHYAPPLPEELQHLTWNAPGGVSPIVSDCVIQAGFDVVDVQVRKKEDQCFGSIWDCLPICEKEKDEISFASLSPEVKINQFPGLFVIGRKDSLSLCYEEMVRKFGGSEFGFLPKTYILPDDKDEVVKILENSRKPMIIKPPNWFCGIGIKLINKIEDIPLKESKMVVQEYIDNPFLIRGLKFDLRLYVLLTSIDPIKLYIYEEGLVRFATEEYTNNPEKISNNFIHLTNYSVNKESDEFIYNETPGDYSGHKWNLSTLWRYLSEVLCIDWRPVWEQTKEICLKTVLCGHKHIKREVASQIKSEYNCYKLLGFDVFYDADLKPWLLEVNNIPSLHADTIDSFVNRPMVAEMFNIVGFHVSKDAASKNQKAVSKKLGLEKLGITNIGFDDKMYSKIKSDDDVNKQNKFMSDKLSHEEYIENILDDISPSDARTIIRSEDELSQTVSWTRIFPTPSTHPYLHFFPSPSYPDQLLHAWEGEYGTSQEKREEGQKILRNLCNEKHHLKVPINKVNTQNTASRRAANKEDDQSTNNGDWMDIDMFRKFQ